MNTTSETEACRNYTENWINRSLNPRKTVERAEICVIIAAVFMLVLATLSPRRRQSQSIIIRYAVELVFILSFPLLSYTMGLMHAGQIKNELYPVWAMFLAMLFGGTNAMSAQKLDQNKHPMKLYCDCLLFSFYLGIVLGGFLFTIGKDFPYIRYILLALCLLLGFRNVEQWGAASLASKPSSENGIKWLALYMKREHQLSMSYDARTMQGYKYAVLIHESTRTGESAITLEDIWCHNIGALSSSDRPPIRHLKDVCLSFALFHLVVRRYFGYTCPEYKLDKTRDLVLLGLLRMEGDYERAFQVIEAELAFLYDFFFTKYAFIMYGKEVWWCALTLTLTLFSIAAGALSLSVKNTHNSILYDLLVETSGQDVTVTKIALVALSIFELLQIWSYCASDWAKVSFVCKYVANPSWHGNTRMKKLLDHLGRPHRWLRYWCNTIGQYSVLDSSSPSCWDRMVRPSQRRKADNPVELPKEVKKAVAVTIKSSATAGHVSNGASALMKYRMSGLRWACQISDEFTPTHIILVWHIATSYCEISETVRRPDDIYVHPNQSIATSLSKYCAYLVAFAPTLLPGSAVESECTLGDLEREAKGVLRNHVSPSKRYEILRELCNAYVVPSNANNASAREITSAELLSMGVIVGKALEQMENRTIRWDLLAELWAEMLVYIAPSDDVASHIELLPQGGEFVTHVWALLMHAGILERPAAGATSVP